MICIAPAWVVLMKRLGYTQFVAQGGDWGALIVDMMGVTRSYYLINGKQLDKWEK